MESKYLAAIQDLANILRFKYYFPFLITNGYCIITHLHLLMFIHLPCIKFQNTTVFSFWLEMGIASLLIYTY